MRFFIPEADGLGFAVWPVPCVLVVSNGSCAAKSEKNVQAGRAYDWVEASSGSIALPALASGCTNQPGQKMKLLRAADLERTSRLESR